jgi:hypothetical protein
MLQLTELINKKHPAKLTAVILFDLIYHESVFEDPLIIEWHFYCNQYQYVGDMFDNRKE